MTTAPSALIRGIAAALAAARHSPGPALPQQLQRHLASLASLESSPGGQPFDDSSAIRLAAVQLYNESRLLSAVAGPSSQGALLSLRASACALMKASALAASDHRAALEAAQCFVWGAWRWRECARV